MNARTVTGLIVAPLACGAVFAGWFLFSLERPESQIGVSPFVLFLPGVMYGAVFEVIVLLPLLLVVRRFEWPPRATLLICGALLWVLGMSLYTLATSELAGADLTVRDIALIHLPITVAGVALVAVFTYFVGNTNAA